MHEILKQVKLIYSKKKIRAEIVSAKELTRKGHDGNFEGDNDVLF